MIENLESTPDFELSQALQGAITEFNKSFIHLMLTAARSQDPLAPVLLGLSEETLASYQNTPSFSLLSAHRFGLPLAVARFKDPETIREVFRSGFSQAQVIALLTREIDSGPLLKSGQNGS